MLRAGRIRIGTRGAAYSRHQTDRGRDDEVPEQNIIFFAKQHGEKVRLNDAAPQLLNVYLHHEREAFRMTALAALHAIGDEEAMEQRAKAVRREASERVRRVTLAALNDHYHKKR